MALSTEDIVTGLLDDIFGISPMHKVVAGELVPRYNDNRSSLISVLRYLNHYRQSGRL